MSYTGGSIEADDIALRIDTARKSGCRTREIDSGKLAFLKQESMDHAAGNIISDDIALRVNTERKGEGGAWGIDGGEGDREGGRSHRDNGKS
jgi:hypothetical protein